MYCCTPSKSKIWVGRIPKGYAGTRRTVDYIIDLVKECAKDFCLRQTAINILIENNVPPKDYFEKLRLLKKP
jgi:hypothetical protein